MGTGDDLKHKAEEAVGPTPAKLKSADEDKQVRGSLDQAAEDLTDDVDQLHK